MNFAELLTYTDIDQLNRIRKAYGFEGSVHSKNELIRTLLNHLGRRRELAEQIRGCDGVQTRFLQLLFFDSRDVFSMEEFWAKRGRPGGQEGGSSQADPLAAQEGMAVSGGDARARATCTRFPGI